MIWPSQRHVALPPAREECRVAHSARVEARNQLITLADPPQRWRADICSQRRGVAIHHVSAKRVLRVACTGVSSSITRGSSAHTIFSDDELRIDPRCVRAGEVVDGHARRG